MLGIQWFPAEILTELTLLAVTTVLCSLIGFERQRKLKSAGLRTHTLVGLGSALFTLVSAYGFAGITDGTTAMLDPSRIAAQVVSGIGFLGAGVIFVRRDSVSGLTTAASIWVSAAVGMACGAGMPVLAAAATGLHLAAMWLLGLLGRRFRSASHEHYCTLKYRENRGVLRTIMTITAAHGCEVALLRADVVEKPGKSARIRASLRLRGDSEVEPLLEKLMAIPGVDAIRVTAGPEQT